MHLDRDEAMRRASSADHAVLATRNRTGTADVVPVCYSVVGDSLAVPVDSIKPKRSTALGRIRNLERDPRATLLVEHWDPTDWSRLWWVRLALRRRNVSSSVAEALEQGLRERYPQYAGEAFVALLTFQIESVVGWSAA